MFQHYVLSSYALTCALLIFCSCPGDVQQRAGSRRDMLHVCGCRVRASLGRGPARPLADAPLRRGAKRPGLEQLVSACRCDVPCLHGPTNTDTTEQTNHLIYLRGNDSTNKHMVLHRIVIVVSR